MLVISMGTRVVLWRVLALYWITHIFLMSTGSFSSERTQSLLTVATEFFHLGISDHWLEVLNRMGRKLAHVTEYAVLSFLIYRSFQGRYPLRWNRNAAVGCVLAAILYSAADEFHQRYVPGRGPSLADCGIDAIGAAMGILVIHLQIRLKQKRIDPRIEPAQ
jgi:VanZ family protein